MCHNNKMNNRQFRILLDKQFVNVTKQTMITVEVENSIVAGCLLFEADNIMIMGSVYTMKSKRKRGYAQQVLDKVEEMFHNSNKKVLSATVEKGTFIEKFYIKNGFKIVGGYDGNESIIIKHK